MVGSARNDIPTLWTKPPNLLHRGDLIRQVTRDSWLARLFRVNIRARSIDIIVVFHVPSNVMERNTYTILK